MIEECNDVTVRMSTYLKAVRRLSRGCHADSDISATIGHLC